MKITVTFEIETRFAIPHRSRVIVDVDGEKTVSDWVPGESNRLHAATIAKLHSLHPGVAMRQVKTTREAN